MVSKVVIPDLGATEDDVVLNEWLVKPGDFVKAGTPLFLVTTDKAIVEVEAFRDGYIREVLVSEEAKVPVGEAVALMADSMEEPVVDVSPQEPVEVAVPKVEQRRVEAKTERVLASPLARRMAREFGINLSSVKGTGEGGRIHKRDVLVAVKTHVVSAPEVTPPAHTEGVVRRVPVSPMRRAIAERTTRSKAEAPHFYVSVVIDMTEVQAFRKQIAALAEKNGWISPSLTDVVIRAAALALKQTPQLNASFQGGEILYFEDIHIGLVVGLSEGMIVPVIRRADQKNLYTLAAITRRLKDKAVAGKLSESELTGSTFTISNLGMFGVDSFFAVINPPEAAILALGAVRLQPAVWEGKIVPRELMTATLSADHRLVDGITAARFLGEFKEILENPIRLVLEPPEEDSK
jgi:pyruvate dehydrogenase E2 component (dihydrolipoamide acetyltransferase)